MSLLGYRTDQLSLFPMSQPSPASSDGGNKSKKQRVNDNGNDGDWDFLLASVHHLEAGGGLSKLLGLESVCREGKSTEEEEKEAEKRPNIDIKAQLFPNLAKVFLNLHLLYEDMKLDKVTTFIIFSSYALYLQFMSSSLPYLCGLLFRLSTDFGAEKYVDHYARDFPEMCPAGTTSTDEKARKLHPSLAQSLTSLPQNPPCIRSHLKKVRSL